MPVVWLTPITVPVGKLGVVFFPLSVALGTTPAGFPRGDFLLLGH